MSDEALMRKLAAGDRAAGRAVAHRLLPRCKRIVRAVAGDHPEYEDIVQLCLVDVLRGAGTYRGDAALETWATRIWVRRALKATRRHRKEEERVDGGADVSGLPEEETSVRALRESLPRPLEHYLDQLPDVHREAVVLRYGLGYAVAEIAALTGAAPNTIKVRLYQGLKKIRAAVERDLQGAEGRR